MRGKLLAVMLVVAGALAYIAAPFYTAWTIRDAAKNSKPSVLATSVYWPTVKVTLKESLKKIATPEPLLARSTSKRPGLMSRMWHRVKTSLGRSVVNRLVDSYANPEGFAKVFSYGRTYRTQIRGWKDPEESLPLFARIKAVWARVRRAEFKSWTRFELDMVDKFEPLRMYCGVLELRGFRWMLTEVRVLQTGVQQIATNGGRQLLQRIKTAAVPRTAR